MCVLIRTEDTKDVVILVDRLAEIASLLLIPPVTIGIAELALYCGRVDVATVLDDHRSVNTPVGGM